MFLSLFAADNHIMKKMKIQVWENVFVPKAPSFLQS